MSTIITQPASALVEAAKASERNGLSLSLRQIAILHVIADNPGISTGPLAEAVRAPKGRVSDSCTALMRRGLILRTSAVTDKRLASMRVTPAGIAALARMVAALRRDAA